MTDPIYGIFAAQIGYAKSFKVADSMKYEKIFLDAINIDVYVLHVAVNSSR